MTTPGAAGLTLALATKSSALTFADLPADVVELARQCLLDWFGVTLSGISEDAPQILLSTLPPGDPADPRTVSVVGRTVRLTALHAALVNGTASHRLDFDDVNAAFLGHVSVAVLGAALALGEQLNATGQELITAFVAGYETAVRIAVALGPKPYLRGFHSTGTVGTFGASAACAHLLGLDAARTATAFGLASTQAAGLKSGLGTMSKSFHAGKACENGLLAALLAERGFTATSEAIEDEQGFAATAGGDCDARTALADPPSGWHLRDNLFKYHASCFMTHSMIEGIRELRAAEPFAAEDVRQLTVHVGELELGACAIAEPATGLEVKFSLRHLAAMALLDRGTGVITDADAKDQRLVAVRSKVVLADDAVPGQPTRVEIELGDGRVLRAARDLSLPNQDLSVQHRWLSQKFLLLAEPVLGVRAASLLDTISGLDATVDVRRLLSLTHL